MSIESGVDRAILTDLNGDLAQEAIKDIHRATRSKRYRRYYPLWVNFIRKGRYTCATVYIGHDVKGYAEGVGFSKCRATDKLDPNIGDRVAMRRAIEDAVNG